MNTRLFITVLYFCCTGFLCAKEPLPEKLDYILGLDRSDTSLTTLSEKFGLVESYGSGNQNNAKCYKDKTHIVEFYETSIGYGYTVLNRSEPFIHKNKCGELNKSISIIKTSKIFSLEMNDVIKFLGNGYTKEEKIKQSFGDWSNNKKPEKQTTYFWRIDSTTIGVQFKNNKPYWLNVNTEEF